MKDVLERRLCNLVCAGKVDRLRTSNYVIRAHARAGFRQPERCLLSRRDQGTALLVFLVLGLIEEAPASHAGWLNERIVAVCAGGLLAGPWVGLAVSVFVTWLAVAYHRLPLAPSAA